MKQEHMLHCCMNIEAVAIEDIEYIYINLHEYIGKNVCTYDTDIRGQGVQLRGGISPPDPLQQFPGLVPGDVDHQRRHADGGGADDEPGHGADQRPPPHLPGISQLQVGSERRLSSDL